MEEAITDLLKYPLSKVSIVCQEVKKMGWVGSCSYCAMLGRVKSPAWLTTDVLLGEFGKSRSWARKKYQQLRYRQFIDEKLIVDPYVTATVGRNDTGKEMNPHRHLALALLAPLIETVSGNNTTVSIYEKFEIRSLCG